MRVAVLTRGVLVAYIGGVLTLIPSTTASGEVLLGARQHISGDVAEQLGWSQSTATTEYDDEAKRFASLSESLNRCFVSASFCHDGVRVQSFDKNACDNTGDLSPSSWHESFPNSVALQTSVQESLSLIQDADEPLIFVLHVDAKAAQVDSASQRAWGEELQVELFNYVRCGEHGEFFFAFTSLRRMLLAQSIPGNIDTTLPAFVAVIPLPDTLKVSPWVVVKALELRTPGQSESTLASFARWGGFSNIVKGDDAGAKDQHHAEGTIQLSLAPHFNAPEASESHDSSSSSSSSDPLSRARHLASRLREVMEPHVEESVIATVHTATRVSVRAKSWLALHDVHSHARRLTSEIPEVYWVSLQTTNHLHNLDAAMLTQTGTEFTSQNTNAMADLAARPADVYLPFWRAGIRGQGQVVQVGDSGLDTNSCFFRDQKVPMAPRTRSNKEYLYPNHRKVVQYFAHTDGDDGKINGHGTHVAGTVAGSADAAGLNANPQWHTMTGMAPEARLAMFDMGRLGSGGIYTPNDLGADMFAIGYRAGARISTNSWGAKGNSKYDSNAIEVDTYLYKQQDFLAIFSAGNSGGEGVSSLGAPSTSKNAVTVGASTNSARSFAVMEILNGGSKRSGTCPLGPASDTGKCSSHLAQFSSIGPTLDGRAKPDVVAPGYYVGSASAQKECDANFKSGTSMAAPVVAGSAALVRQFFEDGWYPRGRAVASSKFDPMGALIKAVLLNSGRQLTGKYRGADLASRPRSVQGHGAIQLDRTLVLDGVTSDKRKLFVDGSMAHMPVLQTSGSREIYLFRILPGSALPFTATLVWHDFPGAANSKTNLVNDLDLSVEIVSSETDESPEFTVRPLRMDNINRGVDRVNNAEHVELSTQDADQRVKKRLSDGGWLRVVVTGFAIARGPQPFALVVNGPFEMSTARRIPWDGSDIVLLFQQIGSSGEGQGGREGEREVGGGIAPSGGDGSPAGGGGIDMTAFFTDENLAILGGGLGGVCLLIVGVVESHNRRKRRGRGGISGSRRRTPFNRVSTMQSYVGKPPANAHLLHAMARSPRPKQVLPAFTMQRTVEPAFNTITTTRARTPARTTRAAGARGKATETSASTPTSTSTSQRQAGSSRKHRAPAVKASARAASARVKDSSVVRNVTLAAKRSGMIARGMNGATNTNPRSESKRGRGEGTTNPAAPHRSPGDEPPKRVDSCSVQ